MLFENVSYKLNICLLFAFFALKQNHIRRSKKTIYGCLQCVQVALLHLVDAIGGLLSFAHYL